MKNRTKEMNELRSIVISEMTEKVRFILSRSESEGLQWKGTKTDLVELLHEVYYHCGITMEDGSYATFTYLVERAFSVFGMTPPRNPRARGVRAESRKTVIYIYHVCFIVRMRCSNHKCRNRWHRRRSCC